MRRSGTDRVGSKGQSRVWVLALVGLLCLALAGTVFAQDNTTISVVTHTPDPVAVNSGALISVTVTNTGTPGGPDPTGDIVFGLSLGSGSMTPFPPGWTVPLAGNGDGSSSCTATYTPDALLGGTHTLTVTYAGDGGSFNAAGNSPVSHDVNVVARKSHTIVECSDTELVVNNTATCTVSVVDISGVDPEIPTGTVSISVSPGGNGTLSSTGGTLDEAGQFTFTYTPTNGNTTPHTITASYSGSTVHSAGSGSFGQAIAKRAADLALDCSHTVAYVNQPITCVISLADDTTEGTPAIPGGSNTLSFSDGGKNGVFTPAGPVTPTAGSYAVIYTPAPFDAGTTLITVSYAGSEIHAPAAVTQQLTIELRPTETLVTGCPNVLVNEPCIYTIDVSDLSGAVGGTLPAGNCIITRVDPKGAAIHPGFVAIAGSTPFSYTQLTFDIVGDDPDAPGGQEPIRVDYVPLDGIHDVSAGGYVQAVQRRPTETTLNCIETPTGCNCTVAVAEDSGNAGIPVLPPVGNFYRYRQNDTEPEWVAVGPAFSIVSDDILVSVNVKFEASNQIHLNSTDAVHVDRSAFIQGGTGDGTTGADCNSGCGDGGVYVDALILGLNTAVELLSYLQLGLDIADIPISVIPDAIWGAGIGAVSGSEIPIKDIVMAVTAGIKTGAEAAKMEMERDLDGDGIPSIIERLIGTNDFLTDSDGDGIDDAGEVSAAGGWSNIGLVGFRVGNRRPDPVNEDSDGDGLKDGYEADVTKTDFCVADTDCDTIPDGAEAASGLGVTDGFVAGYTYGSPAYTFPFDIKDQTNPREWDSDGDGLTDTQEFAPGLGSDETDGYANVNDSDGDGLIDWLDTATDLPDASGNDGELGSDSMHSIEDPDSDGDGLSDGEEYHTGTNMLDWDSDNDGLSDFEEVRIYFTNPNVGDTDGDLADGVLATRDAAYFDSSHPSLVGYSGPDTIACDSDCEEAFSGTALGAFVGNPLDETDPLQVDTDGDGINDNIEFNPGCNEGAAGPGTGSALFDGFANSFDSDGDGLKDVEDAYADVFNGDGSVNNTPMTRSWLLYPETPAPVPGGAKAAGDGVNDGEINDDLITCLCDPDSDGDGVLDGEEYQLGIDPYDWDTDDDGRSDGEELTGGGPIPSDPEDFDTDDDGLGDGVEVYGVNPTNPLNADTDSDGLADGGLATPSSVDGIDGSGTNALVTAGVANHPNPYGYGEDENGDGAISAGETNPNDYDSDDDALGDGVEKLAYSVSRASAIPAIDMLGRPITVTYPPDGVVITYPDCSCLDPLDADTDDDGLMDGEEDLNHDGNFDFNPSDFDNEDLLDGAPQPDPEETHPCDPDTDDDGLTDFEERYQPNPSVFYPFNPTNPLDHDTDNDYLYDGEEVNWICVDPGFDLDPDMDGIDDFFVMEALGGVLDPTNRDSDSDRFIDGLDPNPCYSWLIPIGTTLDDERTDTDGDGFSDADEIAAGTDPNDGAEFPVGFDEDYDRDLELDDTLWLEDYNRDGNVDSVAIDLAIDGLVDARIRLVPQRDVRIGDFDADGEEDDLELTVVYAFSNGRYTQPRVLLRVIDLDTDMIVDEVVFAE